jgi:hypothetical protein
VAAGRAGVAVDRDLSALPRLLIQASISRSISWVVRTNPHDDGEASDEEIASAFPVQRAAEGDEVFEPGPRLSAPSAHVET